MIFQAAAAAAAFNLICTGTVQSTSATGRTATPYSMTYRIDLSQGKWCDGECAAPRDLARVLPTQLVLQDDNEDSPRRREMMVVQIDRDTGAHRIFATSGIGVAAIVMRWEGRCQRAPFSGFPSPRTQF